MIQKLGYPDDKVSVDEAIIFFWDSAIEIMKLSFEDWRETDSKAKWVFDQLSFERFERGGYVHLDPVGTRTPVFEVAGLIKFDAISRAAVSRLILIGSVYPSTIRFDE